MAECYQCVKAKSREEAIKNSKYFIGQKAEVESFQVNGSINGDWTVLPHFKLTEEKSNG